MFTPSHQLLLVEMEKQYGWPDKSSHKQLKPYASQCLLCEKVETDVGRWVVCTRDVEFGELSCPQKLSVGHCLEFHWVSIKEWSQELLKKPSVCCVIRT